MRYDVLHLFLPVTLRKRNDHPQGSRLRFCHIAKLRGVLSVFQLFDESV